MKIKLIFISLSIITGIVIGTVFYQNNKSGVRASVSAKKTFTLHELNKYNGVDPKLPIYLALDGNIYDVTAGKEFYKLGGSYHDLAGKDSSQELHLIGGEIIKRKYPIIGKLVTVKN